jgi:hypothetical protein
MSGLPKDVYENGLPDEQEKEWERILEAAGRVPWISYPNLCAKCGQTWPEMFRVPDDEWKRYVQLDQRGRMLCRECFEWIKSVIDAEAAHR